MAATFSTSPLKFLFLLVLLQYFLHNGHCLVSCAAAAAVAVTDRHAVIWSLNRFRRGFFKPNNLPTRPLFSLSKHGYTCIYLPSTTDITFYMDVELNPGPVISSRSAHYLSLSQADRSTKLSQTDVTHGNIWSASPVRRFVYSRTDLVRLCPFYLDLYVLNRPRNWKYRGRRAGKLSKAKEANGTMSILSIVRSRTFVNGRSSKNNRRSANLANLIPVESDTTANKHREKDFNVKSSYFGLLNCRSVCNKAIILKDYIGERNFDIFAITETWLRPGDIDGITIGDLVPNGYCFYHAPREGRGGGVGVMLKRTLMVVSTEYFTNFRSLEAIGIQMKVLSKDVYIVIIYRPPLSSGNNSMNCFMEEFSSLLEDYVVKSESLLIAGDFNFHIDNSSDVSTTNFIYLLEAFNLRLHATQATHRAGNVLDLIIDRNDDNNFVHSVDVHDPMISDHFTLLYSCRNLKLINSDAFRDSIEKSSFLKADFVEVSQSVELYNSELLSILDFHAPLSTRTITVRPAAPWYSNEIKIEKRKRRQLERHWRKRRLPQDRLRFAEQCRLVNRLLWSS